MDNDGFLVYLGQDNKLHLLKELPPGDPAKAEQDFSIEAINAALKELEEAEEDGLAEEIMEKLDQEE